MSLFYIKYLFPLLILYHSAFGSSKLPQCQCECCPGEQCRSHLLVFSVDYCNETTCSFEQCHNMYPKKCGLRPGFTNSTCSIHIMNNTTIQPKEDFTVSVQNTTSTLVIIPTMILYILSFIFFMTK
ncbi:hypothetical protein I4U23_009311 [Adineta vaga]|nr:hypothetical protein I4U23_009311 [Adineta vaga]